MHPYRKAGVGEYDISHFLLKIAEAYDAGDPDGSDGVAIFSQAKRWAPGVTQLVNDLIYPQPLNGHVYVCVSAGKTGNTPPIFPMPSVLIPHPTVVDGAVTWKHNSLFRMIKVASLISLDNTDEDIGTAIYTVPVKGLDPKKLYIIQVVPYDVYGRGSPSDIATGQPGTTEDDDEEAILAPGQVTGVTLEVIPANKLKGSWTLLPDTDILKYYAEYRAVEDPDASSEPSLLELQQGYLDSDPAVAVYGQNVTINVKDSTETASQNWVIIETKVGYKYFLRIRFMILIQMRL